MVKVGSYEEKRSLFPRPNLQESIEDNELCSLCESDERLEKHHVSYFPEKLILVCKVCHSKIHHDETFHPELRPPKEDGIIFYGKKDPTEVLNISLSVQNGIKIELLEIQQRMGLNDVNEVLRFIIHQYYQKLNLNLEMWD